MCYGAQPEALIVVVARNRAGLTACLDPLIAAVAHAEQHGLRSVIYVIDNGSEDAVVDLLEGYHDSVYWMRFSRECGYAQVRNHALRLARRDGYRHVICIDPQVHVPPALIADMLDFMHRNADVGLAEARATRPGSNRDRPHPHAERDGGEPTGETRLPAPADTDMSTVDEDAFQGLAFIARTRTLTAIGGFDDTHRTDLALNDLCRRARFAQWRTLPVPGLTVTSTEPAPQLGGGVANAALRDTIYYFACNPLIRWRELRGPIGLLLAMDLVASARRRPFGPLVCLAGFAMEFGALAWRWRRILQARRTAQRLIDHPTGNPTVDESDAVMSQ